MILQVVVSHLGFILVTYLLLRLSRQFWTVLVGIQIKSQLRILEEGQEVVGGVSQKLTSPSETKLLLGANLVLISRTSEKIMPVLNQFLIGLRPLSIYIRQTHVKNIHSNKLKMPKLEMKFGTLPRDNWSVAAT